MLEQTPPSADTALRAGPDDAVRADEARVRQDGHPEGALRRMDWRELSARLNAARDLREVLRREELASEDEAAVAYAHQAARYFRPHENGKPDINPVALERRKGSPGMILDSDEGSNTSRCSSAQIRGNAAQGDARDK